MLVYNGYIAMCAGKNNFYKFKYEHLYDWNSTSSTPVLNIQYQTQLFWVKLLNKMKDHSIKTKCKYCFRQKTDDIDKHKTQQ